MFSRLHTFIGGSLCISELLPNHWYSLAKRYILDKRSPKPREQSAAISMPVSAAWSLAAKDAFFPTAPSRPVWSSKMTARTRSTPRSHRVKAAWYFRLMRSDSFWQKKGSSVWAAQPSRHMSNMRRRAAAASLTQLF